jgi:hypothetical protein
MQADPCCNIFSILNPSTSHAVAPKAQTAAAPQSIPRR